MTKPWKKIYIAGPIAGYPNGNADAFAAAEDRLRSWGFEPVNPHSVAPHEHEGDCPDGPPAGQTPDGIDVYEHTAPCFMRTDLAAMLSCDVVYLLKGFYNSKGATAELATAKAAGLHVIYEGDVALDIPLLEHQIEWSKNTFGPDVRPGVVDHIEKELKEIRDSEYRDLEEWIDVMILGVDGAWRSGADPADIIETFKWKLEKNFRRQWPDWRETDGTTAIEHVKGIED